MRAQWRQPGRWRSGSPHSDSRSPGVSALRMSTRGSMALARAMTNSFPSFAARCQSAPAARSRSLEFRRGSMAPAWAMAISFSAFGKRVRGSRAARTRSPGVSALKSFTGGSMASSRAMTVWFSAFTARLRSVPVPVADSLSSGYSALRRFTRGSMSPARMMAIWFSAFAVGFRSAQQRARVRVESQRSKASR